jgi:histidine ammonia-lyase
MIILGDHSLTIEEIIQVARKNEVIEIGDNAKSVINRSHDRLNKIIQSDKPIYGINTGFGIFSDRKIKAEECNQLSRNLILSHAVGTGPVLPIEVTRAAMLVRANTLAKGYSGVRLEVIETLVEMLNKGVTPVIPSQGSLGSSGDLCPLSHMALVLTNDERDLEIESGYAEIEGLVLTGKAAMQKAGIKRIILGPKEGLAINNGATFSAAIGALAVFDAEYLANLADRSIALTLEALLGCSGAFDKRIHEARGQIGQIESAKNIRESFEGSTFVDSTDSIQDAYSLRCAPQIHGGVRETIHFVRQVIEREVNAATDNPLIFEPDVAISGGNFHGEPVGLVMDYLSIALCELGAIAERRIFRMTDGKLNAGLPPMLVDTVEKAGLNSGLMMLQYTAASLVLENQTLATPDSVHSLPTSAEQEDHNANAMTAARHAAMIIENIQQILGLEIYMAVRAMDLRKRLQVGKMGKLSQILYDRIRSHIKYTAGDTYWGPEINFTKQLVKSQEL